MPPSLRHLFLPTCWAGKPTLIRSYYISKQHLHKGAVFVYRLIYLLYLTMRKFGVFSTFLFLSIVAAGAYGMLHDQVTASISPEYFTRFKFPQFHMVNPEPFRLGVAIVGFYATWWTGALIGLVLGLTGFNFPDHKTMRAALYKSLLLVSIVTILTGCCGFIYGKYIQDPSGVSWWLPDSLRDKTAFILVGNIHNFSYLGGLAGLLVGFIYLLSRKRNTVTRTGTPETKTHKTH